MLTFREARIYYVIKWLASICIGVNELIHLLQQICFSAVDDPLCLICELISPDTKAYITKCVNLKLTKVPIL